MEKTACIRRIGAARALLILTVLLSCAASARPAHAATGDSGAGNGGPWALFAAGTVPSEPPAADRASVELGVRFSVAEPPGGDYRVTAVRFYRAPSRPMVENPVFIYDKDGEPVAQGLFIGEGGPTGVVDVRLREPLTLRPGETYTASYLTRDGGYSYEYGAFDRPIEVGPITFPTDAGVFRYGGGFPRCSYEGMSYYVSPVIELGGTVPPPPPPRDTTIPSVNILEPSDLATVPADTPFYVRARLTDDGGVLQEVRLLIDGAVIQTVPNPWSGSTINFPVTLPAGLHLIEIRAEDPAGNVGDDTLRLTALSTNVLATDVSNGLRASRPTAIGARWGARGHGFVRRVTLPTKRGRASSDRRSASSRLPTRRRRRGRWAAAGADRAGDRHGVRHNGHSVVTLGEASVTTAQLRFGDRDQ